MRLGLVRGHPLSHNTPYQPPASRPQGNTPSKELRPRYRSGVYLLMRFFCMLLLRRLYNYLGKIILFPSIPIFFFFFICVTYYFSWMTLDTLTREGQWYAFWYPQQRPQINSNKGKKCIIIAISSLQAILIQLFLFDFLCWSCLI
jgi:hypothetical protein